VPILLRLSLYKKYTSNEEKNDKTMTHLLLEALENCNDLIKKSL